MKTNGLTIVINWYVFFTSAFLLSVFLAYNYGYKQGWNKALLAAQTVLSSMQQGEQSNASPTSL